jgi:RNA polymerase sigma-70 factor (ECF subfamily)
MAPPGPVAVPDYAALADADLVGLARHGHREAFRHIMQRGNQRLFRIARGVLNDDAEAEDAVQEAWTHAFAKLDGFRGEASVLTWMTRIVLNEAYGRLRRRRPTVGVDQIEASQVDGARVIPFPSKFGIEDPAATATRSQVRELVEHAIAGLPEPFRIVFIMRQIEECTVEETAQALCIRPETVKTRLHRARRLLRADLQDTVQSMLTDAFPFLGVRCARMTEAVLQHLPLTDPSP